MSSFMALTSLFPRVGRTITASDISVPLLFFGVNIASLTPCPQAQGPGDGGGDGDEKNRDLPVWDGKIQEPAKRTDTFTFFIEEISRTGQL